MSIDPVRSVNNTEITLYVTFMTQLEGSEETEPSESPQLSPKVPEGKQFITSPNIAMSGMRRDRNIEALLKQTETPVESRERAVTAVLNKDAWSVFQEKVRAFSEIWERKLVDRSLKILTGGAGVVADYLAYLFIFRKAAVTSAGQTSVQSTTAAPNLKTLRYAGAAGLCSNSLTLIEAIPQTVLAMVQIVGAIKSGVDLRQQIKKDQAQLLEVTNQLGRESLSDDQRKISSEKRVALEASLAQSEELLSSLPLQGVISATFGVFSVMSTVQGAVGIAAIALFSGTHGQVTPLIASLAHVASILGIVAASVGVAFGGASLGFNVNTAKNSQEKIKELEGKITELETNLPNLVEGKKKLAELEVKRLKNELLTERDTLSNIWITMASNTVLTLAGVMGLFAVVGVASGFGSAILGGIGVVLVAISGSISVYHYFKRKETDAILKQEQAVNLLPEAELKKIVDGVKSDTMTDEEIVNFLPAWVKEEQKPEFVDKFKAHPAPYLMEYFKALVKPAEESGVD